VKSLLSLWPSAVIGALLGLIMVPVGDAGMSAMQAMYDASYPVLDMKGKLVARDGDAVLVSLVGKKLRDCTYLRMTAYSTGGDGVTHDAYVLRVDRPSQGDTKPAGAIYDIGVWKVWPIAAATQVEIWSMHQCDGRIVRSPLARVAL
jgi:hypothetical protein